MVFLHRQGSLRPFTRHYPTEDVLDLLQLKDMPDGSTQVQGWLFLDFFFLLENLFSRDNQRLGCQVSNLTIFSFSSYRFFFISSECKQSAKIDPSSENLQTGMHYILIPLEF